MTPASGYSLDFGASSLHLTIQNITVAGVRQRERNVGYWPKADTPVSDCRGSFRGQSGHQLSGRSLITGFGNAGILVIEEERHRLRKGARPNDGFAQRNMLALFISRTVIFARGRLVRIFYGIVVPMPLQRPH